MQLNDSPLIKASLRVYSCLLAAYPRAHRDEYGSDMMQLFRDQCRDAWNDRRSLGLMTLWMRIIPDLLKSSMLEHLNPSKGKTTMALSNLIDSGSVAKRAFFFTAAITFALFYTGNIVATFWLIPDQYSSLVRIECRQKTADAARTAKTDSESMWHQHQLILSPAFLDPVISVLKLDEAFGTEIGAKLTLQETRSLLKNRLELKNRNNPSLIELWVSGRDKIQTALIAEQIASSFVHAVPADRAEAQIVDHAKPGLRPTSPNRPFNVIVGALFCLAAAFAVGAVVAGIAVGTKGARPKMQVF